MAIIKCPSCKNRISDKAKSCSHCNYDRVKGVSATGETREQIESQENLKRVKSKYSLQMQAMAGIILFLTGMLLWYFLGQRQLTSPAHYIELGIAIAGGLWYLSTRVRMIIRKKSG